LRSSLRPLSSALTCRLSSSASTELIGVQDREREDVEDEFFELVTALYWAVDRFADDVERARRRVALATAGVFAP
jgi:hypothetical protein